MWDRSPGLSEQARPTTLFRGLRRACGSRASSATLSHSGDFRSESPKCRTVGRTPRSAAAARAAVPSPASARGVGGERFLGGEEGGGGRRAEEGVPPTFVQHQETNYLSS